MKVPHKCKTCWSEFAKKSELMRHIERVNPCKREDRINAIRLEVYYCKHCKKQDYRSDNRDRHQKVCKSNNENLLERVKINSFPKISPLTYQDLEALVIAANEKKSLIEAFIKYIHFTPERYENHNIYCSNMEGKLAMVYVDGVWSEKSLDKMLTILIVNRLNDLKQITENIKKLDITRLRKRIDIYDSNDPKWIANIKKYLIPHVLFSEQCYNVVKKTLRKYPYLNKQIEPENKWNDRALDEHYKNSVRRKRKYVRKNKINDEKNDETDESDIEEVKPKPKTKSKAKPKKKKVTEVERQPKSKAKKKVDDTNDETSDVESDEPTPKRKLKKKVDDSGSDSDENEQVSMRKLKKK